MLVALCTPRPREESHAPEHPSPMPLAWVHGAPPSGLLTLIKGLDKRIGLCNGGFHGAYQARNLRFHCHPLLPYGGNRPGIEIMFEKEHLIVEGSEDRRHLRFRALHGAQERRVALPSLCQLTRTRPAQG